MENITKRQIAMLEYMDRKIKNIWKYEAIKRREDKILEQSRVVRRKNTLETIKKQAERSFNMISLSDCTRINKNDLTDEIIANEIEAWFETN